jgi:flagellar basal-body rod modification protein FlgD
MLSSINHGITQPYGGELSASAKAKVNLDKDMNSFMMMLVTQLKNQTPDNPLDSNQFAQQLAMFSSVEQQISTNRNLENLVALNTGAKLNNAAAYINKEVEIDRSTDSFVEGSQANFGYHLAKDSKAVEISIINPMGYKIYTTKHHDVVAGNHNFEWKGFDDNKRPQPSGEYRIQVSAIDKHNVPISSSTTIKGIVTEAKLQGKEAAVIVEGQFVPVSKVMGVAIPKNIVDELV